MRICASIKLARQRQQVRATQALDGELSGSMIEDGWGISDSKPQTSK